MRQVRRARLEGDWLFDVADLAVTVRTHRQSRRAGIDAALGLDGVAQTLMPGTDDA